MNKLLAYVRDQYKKWNQKRVLWIFLEEEIAKENDEFIWLHTHFKYFYVRKHWVEINE